MKKRLIIISLFITSSILIYFGSFGIGYKKSKEKYSPKLIDGDLFIDYSQDPKQPSIYLSSVSSEIFNVNKDFVILRLNHVGRRK